MKAKYFNLATLIICIILLFALRQKKQLYYDEPFQIMASHGFSNENIGNYEKLSTVHSIDLDRENKFSSVFRASGDSIHYLLLHYIVLVFGNSLNTYVYFSLFWATLTLVTFYFLSNHFFRDTIFTSISIIILFTGLMFLTEAYSIRHYMMALFFTCLSGLFVFRYLTGHNDGITFFTIVSSCVLAFVSHFLTIPIIISYLVFLISCEKAKLFSLRNIKAALIPLIFLVIYMVFHNPINSSTHVYNYARSAFINSKDTNLSEIIPLFLKNISVNFYLYFPIFKNMQLINIFCFFIILTISIYGIFNFNASNSILSTYNSLLILSASSSLFILVIAFKYKMVYVFDPRFVMFSSPFCSILLVYFFSRTWNKNLWMTSIIILFFFVPILFRFSASHSGNRGIPCNHLLVIQEIQKNGVHKVEVPCIVDAVFINSLLPLNYNITYNINQKSSNAALFLDSTKVNIPIRVIPLIKNDLVVLF